MNARDALLSVEEVVRSVGDRKAVSSFYLEFGRRLEVLRLVEEYCERGSRVLDVGASPFITSCALKRMGYEVVALDVEPEPYAKIAKSCGVSVVKCDLERDELKVGNADCAVFAEVLEHLHYFHAPSILAKINKALKMKGVLILTTPNVASLFRRLRLLLGRQPIYRYHVREYTMEEVLALVEEAGFDVYNVASQDWITVDEVADEVVKAMDLRGVRKVYRPVLHGVGWLGDVKRVALRIDKLKTLGFKPSMNSREAIRATAKKLAEELSCSSQSP